MRPAANPFAVREYGRLERLTPRALIWRNIVNSTVFVGPDGGVLAVWGGHFLPDFGLRGLVATTLDTSGVANFFAASIAASGGTREPVTGAASTGLIGGIQGCGGKAVSGELGLRWRD